MVEMNESPNLKLDAVENVIDPCIPDWKFLPILIPLGFRKIKF